MYVARVFCVMQRMYRWEPLLNPPGVLTARGSLIGLVLEDDVALCDRARGKLASPEWPQARSKTKVAIHIHCLNCFGSRVPQDDAKCARVRSGVK